MSRPEPQPEPPVCSCDNAEYCDPETDPFWAPPCPRCNWHHGDFDHCETDDEDADEPA